MYIFNFHHIEPIPRHPSREHITITPQGLRHVIRSVRAMGMRPVCLRSIFNQQEAQPVVSKHDVLLTFDDGYENFYQYAVPILQEEQCPATVFVVAGRFAGTNDWDQGFIQEAQRDKLMSLEQVQALQATPLISVGSHGMDHRHYPYLSPEELQWEVNESYRLLSQYAPQSFVPALAYPWGEYSPQAMEVLAQSPYRIAFTTQKGLWTAYSHPYQIPRYSIYNRDANPLILFAKLLRYRVTNALFHG